MKLKDILFCVLILFSFSAMAQSGPPATPIDGGLGILLVGGAVYGIRKLVNDQKKQN